MELDQYTFVLIRRGSRAQEYTDDELEELQRGHLAFLDSMRERGLLVIAGPFADQEDETKRGFAIYRTGVDETSRLIEEGDPSVRAGRISIEVMTWLTTKGTFS